MHHVRLCIEGIPLHGWNNYIATFVIGRGCSLDYIKQPSLRKDDTRYLALWAWTANPSAIPKVKWLTLPARGHRRRGRRGLRHRALIHLDLHEDHSKARDDDDNPLRRTFTSSLGTIMWWTTRQLHETVGVARGMTRAALTDATTTTTTVATAGVAMDARGMGGATGCGARFPATRVTASEMTDKTAPGSALVVVGAPATPLHR